MDDLTTIEFVPRSSPSITSVLIKNISEYAGTRSVRLNSKKSKERIVDFLQYRLPFHDALEIGETTIETVTSHKLPGVYIKAVFLYSRRFACAGGTNDFNLVKNQSRQES